MSKKLKSPASLEVFLKLADQRYKDKFDYSKVEFVDCWTPVKITCPKHGEFMATPYYHIFGNKCGCPKCKKEDTANKRRERRKQKFITEAQLKFGNKFDYSHIDNYIDVDHKVEIICPVHGKFLDTPRNHLFSKWGCPKCRAEDIHSKIPPKKPKLTFAERFVVRSHKKFGDKFDYSKMNYVDSKTKITIICPKHGAFEYTPRKHLETECGCPKCNYEKFAIEPQFAKFVEQANEKFNNKFDYSEAVYTNIDTPITIICPIHGKFMDTPLHHLHVKWGCPCCTADEKQQKIDAKNAAIAKRHETHRHHIGFDEFVKLAHEKFGDTFDYTEASNEYKLFTRGEISLTCKIHGKFKITPWSHLHSSCGCPQCNKEAGKKLAAANTHKCGLKNAKIKTEKFIDTAKLVHGDTYDYSNTHIIPGDDMIMITCRKHGEFRVGIRVHLIGRGDCPDCVKEQKDQKMRDQLNEIYGDQYDFSQSEYNSYCNPIKFVCPKHGVVERTLPALKNGAGCPICNNRSVLTEEFIERAKAKHGNKYDYSLVNCTSETDKVTIICAIHGPFNQCAQSHLHGCGCPKCSQSHGENEIHKILVENNIEFISQKTFPGCVDKNLLRFDFYIPSINTCIEYQGAQHYEPAKFFGGDARFAIQQRHDQIKRDFCKENNIPLCEIKYTDNVQNILEKLLNINIS